MIYVILFILLTLLNAYFSAIEIAMVSIRPFRIQLEADQGNASAKRLLTLLKSPEEYLSAVQVGITLVTIVDGLYGGEAFQQYLEPRFLQLGLSSWLAHSLSLLVGIGSITYFTILLGELFPKTLALQNPQKVALMLTGSFFIFTKLFYPFVGLLTRGTHMLLDLFTFKSSESKKLTVTDLKSLLSLAYNQGTIEEHELKLHENIFTFYDQLVNQIMTPLERIVVIKESMTWEDVDVVVRQSLHNYFPVVKENNQAVGFLSAKDFLLHSRKSVVDLVQPICNVHERDKTSDVLARFQKASVNFGVVTGNRGELIGIVTIHDIGESLIGKFA